MIDARWEIFYEDFIFLHLETSLLKNCVESFNLLCTLYNAKINFTLANRYSADRLIGCIMEKWYHSKEASK